MVAAKTRYKKADEVINALISDIVDPTQRSCSPARSPSRPRRSRSRSNTPAPPETSEVIEQASKLIQGLGLSDGNKRTLIVYLHFVDELLQGPDKPDMIPDVFSSNPVALLFLTYEHWKVSRRDAAPDARPLDFRMGTQYANLALCRVNFSSTAYDELAVLSTGTTLRSQVGNRCPNGTLIDMATFLAWNQQSAALWGAGISHL